MATDGVQGKRSDTVRNPPQTDTVQRALSATEPATRRKGLGQGRERARAAWGWVDQVEKRYPLEGSKRGDVESNERGRKRYGTLARKLPGMIQTSGLGQTLAFLFSKGSGEPNKPEHLLFTQLAGHLRENFSQFPAANPMQLVIDLSPTDYRSATREAFAVAEWLKRFAEGRLGTEDE